MHLKRREVPSITEYIPKNEIVASAYRRGAAAHGDQSRVDGSNYFKNHCAEVALIIENEFGISQEIDPELHAAALLHDTTEDTELTYEDLVQEFGLNIANIVDGVSKYKSSTGGDINFETKRKVISHGYEDPRVLMLKIADRLHNLRTMSHMSKESQQRKARETLDIYAPVARALGMWKQKTELEDWSFRYLDPGFEEFSNKVDSDPRRSEAFIAYYKSYIEKTLKEQSIQAEVQVRKNGYWALHEKEAKMARRALGDYSNISDVVSFRIVVDKVRECYEALWAVHHLAPPFMTVDQSRFDEYIVAPRPNGYSAIQTTFVWHPLHESIGQHAVEIAIATTEMEEFNNLGVASLMRKGEKNLDEYLLKAAFVRNGGGEKLSLHLKQATGVDLAYAVLGRNRAPSAESLQYIDGTIVPITSMFENASVVTILTGERKIPPTSWINFSLPETKQLIEQQLNLNGRTEEILTQKVKIDQVLHRRGLLALEDIDFALPQLFSEYGCQSVAELLYIVTRNETTMTEFERNLDKLEITKENLGWTGIIISGKDDAPGILVEVVSNIQKMGKTIIRDESRVNPDHSFHIKLIAKGLTKEEESAVLINLQSNPKFHSVLVV